MRYAMQIRAAQERCRGFSLVEALVALVVLSIGMLGIAALHVEGLRSARTALTRTTAVTLASDIADRIRANRAAKTEYDAVVTSADTDANCEPKGAGCSPTDLAHHDKAVWLGAIENSLPGGTGTIDCDDDEVPATYTITISWAEVGSDTPSSYTLTIQA
jgi:type IV pilus assembly protein PilV